MKRILIPTDYSKNASKAIEFAFLLFGDEVKDDVMYIVLHAYSPIDPAMATSPYGTMSAEIIRDNERKSRKYLQQEAEKLRRMHPESQIEEVLITGGVVPAIRNMVEDKEVDLVIMGAQGKGFIERVFLGSSSMNIAESNRCPVIVVPPEYEPSNRFDKIICAGDFRHFWKPASLNELSDLVDMHHSQLMMLHLYPEEEIDFESLELCQSFFDEIFGEGSYRTEFIDQSASVDLIKEMIVGFGADLLAYCPKDTGFIQRLLQGDLTRQLLKELKVPLLILHEKGVVDEKAPSEEEVDQWKRQLDHLIVQFDLAKKEVEDEINVKKEAAGKRVTQLRKRLNEIEETSLTKWDHLRKEMEHVIYEVKKTFQGSRR